jgi:hypothetical protein
MEAGEFLDLEKLGGIFHYSHNAPLRIILVMSPTVAGVGELSTDSQQSSSQQGVCSKIFLEDFEVMTTAVKICKRFSARSRCRERTGIPTYFHRVVKVIGLYTLDESE